MNSHRRHMLKKRGQAFLFALIVLVMITICSIPFL